MDSVKLSDGRSKSNAGIRRPTGCSSCGLKDYPQNIPHAYCFTALYPGIPKCKHSQDHPQDNFAVAHPFFPTFPFQQHFFPNTTIPPNFCCSQKPLNDQATANGQKLTKNEQQTVSHSPDHHILPQNRKSGNNAGAANEGPHQSGHILKPENGSPYSQSVESQFHSVFQRCLCGDSIPWACSPFIVPVFSYCFLWNSQTPGPNLFPKNAYLSETVCQKNSESPANKKYSCSNESNTAKVSELYNAADERNSSVAVKKPHKPKTEEEVLKKVTAGVPSNTSSVQESISSNEQQEMNECLKSDSEVEEEDDSEAADDDDIKGRTESEVSLKQDEKESTKDDDAGPDVNESLSKESRSLKATSSIQLKSPDKCSDCSLDDSVSENQGNDCSDGFNETNPTNPSKESKEKNSEDEDVDASVTGFKDGSVCKKYIKNFTVTDKISGALNKDVQRSRAAAGDLGGVNFEGYKVRISTTNENEPEKPQEEKFDWEELFQKDAEEDDRRKPSSKNSDENKNSGQKSKSGIAKFQKISNSKTSESKNKNESNKKEKIPPKHKNCFATDKPDSANDSKSKIQKAKKFTNPLQRPTGSETQQKLQKRKQPVRKEKGPQHTAERPSSTYQKTDKTSLRR